MNKTEFITLVSRSTVENEESAMRDITNELKNYNYGKALERCYMRAVADTTIAVANALEIAGIIKNDE